MHSLSDFITAHEDHPAGTERFTLASDHLLGVRLAGDDVWTKRGAMVAYDGVVEFARRGLLERGVGNLVKRALGGEGGGLVRASGAGRLFLADGGKRIALLRLASDAIVVNGNDVLAFETSVQDTITMMRRIAGLVSGGLFNIRLEGTGIIAITTHHRPLVLRVRPGRPIVTDPHATVAWSGSLAPSLRADLTVGTLIGRGSGEALQMVFDGDGIVLVQPAEEVSLQHR
jgi:uncharacterized protein (AIM24 family)